MHYTVNWFCTFLQTHYLPLTLFLFVWSWNLCHEIAREFISFVLCVSVSNFIYATFLPPGPFLFCLREIFASLFYLLTLYNIVFTFFLFSLRPIICSYETKLNFSSLLFLFFFCFFIRLEDCCCCLVFFFSLQRTMCTADVTIYLRACACIGELAYFDGSALACVCVWVRLLK